MNYVCSSFDFYRSSNGSWNEYYIEPIINTKIKTKNYNCYQESDMNHANCFNDFYMSKLNCTFPWMAIGSSNGSREQCGNKHFIKDLIDLIDGVIKGFNLSLDVQKCLIPNCNSLTWKITRHDSSNISPNTSGVGFDFDTGRKVKSDFIRHYFFHISTLFTISSGTSC